MQSFLCQGDSRSGSLPLCFHRDTAWNPSGRLSALQGEDQTALPLNCTLSTCYGLACLGQRGDGREKTSFIHSTAWRSPGLCPRTGAKGGRVHLDSSRGGTGALTPTRSCSVALTVETGGRGGSMSTPRSPGHRHQAKSSARVHGGEGMRTLLWPRQVLEKDFFFRKELEDAPVRSMGGH